MNGDAEGEGMLQSIGFFMVVIWIIITFMANYMYNKKVLKMQGKLLLVMNLIVAGIGVAVRVVVTM